MKLKRIIFFNNISTIFQNFRKLLETNNFKRIIIANKEALESLLHKLYTHKNLNYNIQIVKFILPALMGKILFAFTKLSPKTRPLAFRLLTQIKLGFIKFLLFPCFLACAYPCHGGILSLEDLAIEKIISILPKNKFTDIPNIPPLLNKLLAIRIEGKALDTWVSRDKKTSDSIINKKHMFFFKTKLNMHIKNNSNIKFKKKLMEISNYPYFPERNKKKSCDDELEFKPFIHEYGHFFPYITELNPNYEYYDIDSDHEDFYKDSYCDNDPEAVGVYFAYIGSPKYPSCLVINQRDTAIDQDTGSDLTYFSNTYSITEFKNMPWNELTFDLPNVRPAHVNNYSFDLYGCTSGGLKELDTELDEEFANEDLDNEFYEASTDESSYADIDEVFANEVCMMKSRRLFSSEEEYQTELARRTQWEKEKREEKQKKKLAWKIASKKICTEVKLAVFKIIKGIPLPKAYADKIDYTGTFELKVASQ